MRDYGDTSTQVRMDYTSLVRKLVDADEMAAVDPLLYEDLIREGFHRADFKPEDVNGRLVLDVGAHVGMFTALAVANGAKSVMAVELNPENYKKLVRFTSRMDNVRCRNWGISDGSTGFLYPREDGSVCKGYKTGSPGTGVAAMSLDEIMKYSGFADGEVVLKIDVEGSEYDALYCASGNTIRQFRTIFMETHPPVEGSGGGRGAEFLKEYLRFFGFEVVRVTPLFFWTWGSDGKPASCERIKDIELVKLVRS